MGVATAAVLLVVWLAPSAVAQAADPTLGEVMDRRRRVLGGLRRGLARWLRTVGGVR